MHLLVAVAFGFQNSSAASSPSPSHGTCNWDLSEKAVTQHPGQRLTTARSTTGHGAGSAPALCPQESWET